MSPIETWPPLPIVGALPSPWRWVTIYPPLRSTVVVLAVVVSIGLLTPLWGVSLVVLIVAFMTRFAWAEPWYILPSEPWRPAVVRGRRAFVLDDAHYGPDGRLEVEIRCVETAVNAPAGRHAGVVAWWFGRPSFLAGERWVDDADALKARVPSIYWEVLHRACEHVDSAPSSPPAAFIVHIEALHPDSVEPAPSEAPTRPPNRERWCCGVPFLESRPLGKPGRHRVLRAHRDSIQWALVAAVYSVAAYGSLVWSAALILFSTEDHVPLAPILGMLLIMPWPTAPFTIGRNLPRVRKLWADLTEGHAAVYGGRPLAGDADDDDDLKRLLDKGLVHANGPFSIAVTANAGLLLSIDQAADNDGPRPPRPMPRLFAYQSRVAAAPEGVSCGISVDDDGIQRRRLSAAERHELDALSARLLSYRLGNFGSVLLTLVIGALAIYIPLHWGVLVFVGVALPIVSIKLAMVEGRQRILSYVKRNPHAFVLQDPDTECLHEVVGPPDRLRPWTEAGTPAAWRRSRTGW